MYAKHFQNDFNNWTSGNDKIDKFGSIRTWNIENQQWKRYDNREKNPETRSYMMVLEYAEGGNHREYLKNNSNNLTKTSIPEIVYHPILKILYRFQIKDSPEKKNIFGVLPYVVPEVLSGEEYTKAANITTKISILYITRIMRCWNAQVTHCYHLGEQAY
ncbi:hypothetical protein Glove_182g29 [Diversispora epigaea]|uniref:Protein kinase domain-containing protein n=1 Tax=Diversispora epigaea TaxID=1348612 RepID=A0A397ISK4_9GLOM|nr:hypothetical protein Glove_182g29 [Diversispora epigaea]